MENPVPEIQSERLHALFPTKKQLASQLDLLKTTASRKPCCLIASLLLVCTIASSFYTSNQPEGNASIAAHISLTAPSIASGRSPAPRRRQDKFVPFFPCHIPAPAVLSSTVRELIALLWILPREVVSTFLDFFPSAAITRFRWADDHFDKMPTGHLAASCLSVIGETDRELYCTPKAGHVVGVSLRSTCMVNYSAKPGFSHSLYHTPLVRSKHLTISMVDSTASLDGESLLAALNPSYPAGTREQPPRLLAYKATAYGQGVSRNKRR